MWTEDGFYYITGRKKNIIILDNGENVSPEELENLLSKCRAVRANASSGRRGKKICAVIYCGRADQQTVRDFITETNRTLPLYKRMSAVEFSTEPLPAPAPASRCASKNKPGRLRNTGKEPQPPLMELRKEDSNYGKNRDRVPDPCNSGRCCRNFPEDVNENSVLMDDLDLSSIWRS